MADGKLKFDYVLRDGVVKNSIGIELLRSVALKSKSKISDTVESFTVVCVLSVLMSLRIDLNRLFGRLRPFGVKLYACRIGERQTARSNGSDDFD